MDESLSLEVVDFSDLEILEEALAPDCWGIVCGWDGSGNCSGFICGGS